MAEGRGNDIEVGSWELRVVHIVPGVDDCANGMVVVARLLAGEQGDGEVVDLNHGIHKIHEKGVEEVWVHGMWLPKEWLACWMALKKGRRLVRMTHGSLSAPYLKWQSPLKKWLVGPIERWFLRKSDRIVATCEAEAGWIRAYLGEKCPPIEITDIKRFFKLGNRERIPRAKRVAEGDALAGVGTGTTGKTGLTCFPTDRPLHLLYLGRKHPLKGLKFLEEAVRQISSVPHSPFPVPPQLKVVSNAFGEELEKVWNWCDVLVLPTLSDNFGLVVAEALERGKRVITTDGAPAWNREIHETHEKGVWSGYGGRLIYLKGYRDGNAEKRVELLKSAIERVCK